MEPAKRGKGKDLKAKLQEMEKDKVEKIAHDFVIATKVLAILCVVLVCVLAFNIYEMQKYAKIRGGTYVSQTECELYCRDAAFGKFTDFDTEEQQLMSVNIRFA